ncbi:MAG: proton-conducting membrane transporter [Myxococcales bacterium]|nr:proton-conducting membrane transporter [Myxococcales bacterium]
MSGLVEGAVAVAVGAPLALLLLLGAAALGDLLGERSIGALTRAALLAALGAAVTALVACALSDAPPAVVRLGSWFGTAETAFAFDVAVDPVALGFATLSLFICNVVAAFSFRYLHREPGFRRYFFQMAMFVSGITLIALAGSVEVLFVGWELLGLSSALLVGFFQERPAPAANALRVFAIYRLSDAAMLAAAVLLHHWADSGSLAAVFAAAHAPDALLAPGRAFAISLLLIIAVAGKSALWPLSGWLPRAMEGPTPSSAVYYGALSIHAGCFLLLRAQPLILASTGATALLIAGGVVTGLYGALTGRVQTDVKSAISYATLTQVGIITVEIALGLRVLPMLHIAGHACFRLLQFLSAPNVLHDLHELENRLGGALDEGAAGALQTRQARQARPGVYLFALERGFADALLDRAVVLPCRRVLSWLDALDRLLIGDSERKRGRPW